MTAIKLTDKAEIAEGVIFKTDGLNNEMQAAINARLGHEADYSKAYLAIYDRTYKLHSRGYDTVEEFEPFIGMKKEVDVTDEWFYNDI